MKTAQTFSILIWANKSKATKSGLPLFARITVNGRRAEISLKRNAHLDKWDNIHGKIKGTGAEARYLNNYIQEIKAELFKIYHQMVSQNEYVSAEAIKLRFNGDTPSKKTILELINYHNNEMERSVGISIAKGTLTKFNTLQKKLSSFIKNNQKKSDFFLEELDHNFIKQFEYYLRGVEKIGSNTTMKYIRMLKKIMNLAVVNKWLEHNPFKNFKCTFQWSERVVLSMDEIDRIIKKDFEIKRLQLVKDCFIFSCYTGIAFADIQNLHTNDISTGIDGTKWIIKRRQKTNTLFHIPILPEALAIIEKYTQGDANENTVFPKISNQKMNSYLKEIADLCGIKNNLTFHLARHTFATTVTLANGVPIESVSKMLGHSKITTTQIYAKVIEKKLSEDMNALKERLKDKSSKEEINRASRENHQEVS